jgi:hypothetical protein
MFFLQTNVILATYLSRNSLVPNILIAFPSQITEFLNFPTDRRFLPLRPQNTYHSVYKWPSINPTSYRFKSIQYKFLALFHYGRFHYYLPAVSSSIIRLPQRSQNLMHTYLVTLHYYLKHINHGAVEELYSCHLFAGLVILLHSKLSWKIVGRVA